ncbi:PREDICTED: protein LOW PSII ACCUMULATION 2, chloroplastic-like [Populus euphratica]|uniref:Protein LOW PSII ACCUMULATION 2, chloroplastic-like n=1 Tax=Populus euphratica TaxID=75702 RepID=A0AAJ6XSS8_POPEU|nr:PREDICTED: protein LOW PSII ACCUMULATION 2, chloroplastic-like [Populus euphratica]
MALQIHPSLSSSLFKKPSHRLLLLPLRKPNKLKIKAKNPTTNPTPPNKKPTTVSPGRGFGSQSSAAATSSKTSGSWSKKKRKRNRRGRASIVWRTPVEKPGYIRQEYEDTFKAMSRNENAFILAWLALGGIILVEDIVLAASGMLPEEWDEFVVKSLYPSFIPVVGLFVAGTVACGVLKNLQNENVEDLN